MYIVEIKSDHCRDSGGSYVTSLLVTYQIYFY